MSLRRRSRDSGDFRPWRPCAIIAGVWRIFDTIVAPLVAALAVMPIVALAPVLYTMYGADKETARQIVAAVAVIVPVYINTLRGLRQVRPVHRDLMRSYSASNWQETRSVTIPSALDTGGAVGGSDTSRPV